MNWKVNEDPTFEGPKEATPERVFEEDAVSLEHDDDPCDDDCVSDEEHALVVVPGPVVDVEPEPVAEGTPNVVQQDEQRRKIVERCFACHLVYGRGPSVNRRRFD